MTAPTGISRRQALTIAAGVAGASVASAAVVVGTSTPAQAAKASQKIVKYAKPWMERLPRKAGAWSMRRSRHKIQY